MADVWRRFVVSDVDGGEGCVHAKAVPRTVGGGAGEKVVDSLVSWDAVGDCDGGYDWEGMLEAMKGGGVWVGRVVEEGCDGRWKEDGWGLFVESEAMNGGVGCCGHCENEVGDCTSGGSWDAKAALFEAALSDEKGVAG